MNISVFKNQTKNLYSESINNVFWEVICFGGSTRVFFQIPYYPGAKSTHGKETVFYDRCTQRLNDFVFD